MGAAAAGGPVRVAILSNQSLFSVGVERLLRRETTLEIETCELQVDPVRRCLHQFRPQVIIVDKDDPLCEFAGQWMQMLSEVPDARLVELSLRGNSVLVQPGDRPVGTGLDGLVEAIEHPA